MYQEYVQLVNDLCDNITCSYGSDWRDPSYAAYIDSVKVTYLENPIARSDDQREGIQGFADQGQLIMQHHGMAEFPDETSASAVTSGSSISSGTNDLSSATTTTSSSTSTSLDSPIDAISVGGEKAAGTTLAEDSRFPVLNSALAVLLPKALHDPGNSSSLKTGLDRRQSSNHFTASSPTTAVDSSPASATDTLSISPTENRAYCQICSRSFKGTRQHRESNLKRHLNDVHQLGLRLRCSDCDKKCGRADNLRKHRQSVHGVVDPPIRPSSAKRRRESADRRAQTPPSSTKAAIHEPSLW